MTVTTETHLWAKGRRKGGPDPPSVFEHCHDVYLAAAALWEVVEKPLSDATKSQADALRSRIRPLLLVSAMLHDVLKANSAFQDMLRGLLRQHGQQQPVRHEVLAAVFLRSIWVFRG